MPEPSTARASQASGARRCRGRGLRCESRCCVGEAAPPIEEGCVMFSRFCFDVWMEDAAAVEHSDVTREGTALKRI